MEENPAAKAAIMEAVKEQLESPDSPYVKEHHDRLLAEGYDEEEVMKLLGTVLIVEMWEMNKQGRGFDEKQYVDRLKLLPSLDWLDED